MNPEQQRQDLRANLLAQRSSLSRNDLQFAEQDLVKQFRDFFGSSSRFDGLNVAGYLATRGEISPAECLSLVRQAGGISLLPVIRDNQLLFAPYDEQTAMQTGQYNIDIPVCPETDLVTPDNLDIVLVPLVGFDSAGGRLGMGGGYYDRSFEFLQKSNDRRATKPEFLGVAHEFQKTSHVPVEWWDVALDGIITDKSIYKTPERG